MKKRLILLMCVVMTSSLLCGMKVHAAEEDDGTKTIITIQSKRPILFEQ